MVEVPLTQGKVALIDDEDAERVLAYKWCTQWDKSSPRWRAIRYSGRKHGRRTALLHRFIMDAPDGVQVDHINQDPLDNRRSNLRLATNSQNNCNKGRHIDSSTGFKGVWRHKKLGAFQAGIEHQGKKYHLGYFTTAEEAARAYDIAALMLHGEFARVNFPEESELVRRVLSRVRRNNRRTDHD
jgi:HNH endonuclease